MPIQTQIGDESLQLAVSIFQLLYSLELGDAQSCVVLLPLVKRIWTDAHLPADFSNGYAAVFLEQPLGDMLFS